MSKPINRLLLRAAARIRQHLAHPRPVTGEIILPEMVWEECRILLRQARKAQARGWVAAAGRLRERLSGALTVFRRRLEDLGQQLDTQRPRRQPPTPRQIYEELRALDGEFDDVELDLKGGRISVTTDTVVLEGVYLGPFQIVLNWRSIGEPCPYEVVALDARPAASSSDTTHPHVQENTLCEGEARIPIRRALETGRLFDFFLIVRQTLETYNSASAYVGLEEWDGLDCRDCGGRVAEEDRCCCQSCQTDLCPDCAATCGRCRDDFCEGCRARCGGCDENFCTGCLTACADCGRDFCQECMTDERCGDCHDKRQEEGETETKDEANGPTSQPSPGEDRPADFAVQPDSVG